MAEHPSRRSMLATLLPPLLLLTTAAAPPFLSPAELDLEAVSDRELSEQRGGFALLGMDLNFGADMQTFLDGQMVLRTTINWTDQGVDIDQIVSDTLIPTALSDLPAGAPIGTENFISDVNDFQAFTTNAGQTAVLHRTDGQVQNILLNTASNLSVRQEVNVTLDMNGFQSFSTEMMTEKLLSATASMTDQLMMGLGN